MNEASATSDLSKDLAAFKADRLREFREQSNKLKFSGLLYCH